MAHALRVDVMRARIIIGLLACLVGSSLLADRQADQRAARDALVYSVSPRYPIKLQAGRVEGTGMFRMLIDFATGKVTGVVILKSTGSDPLDKEAVFALRQWRFKPGKLTQVDMPITYHNGKEPVVLPPGTVLTPNR